MIPLRVHGTRRRVPLASLTLAILCVITMVRLVTLPAATSTAIARELSIVPARLLGTPASPGQWLTLISACVLHTGWLHLAGNLLFLSVFGPAVEARTGRVGFAALFAIAGAAGGLAYCVSQPASLVPLVGASGAIAGLLGAHLILEPRARVTTLIPFLILFEVATLPAAFVIGVWFIVQLGPALLMTVKGAPPGQVAWMAHVGGFLAGIALATPLALRDWSRASARRRKAAGSRARRLARSSGQTS